MRLSDRLREVERRYCLTAREIDVLGQLLRGKTEKVVATRLGISPQTIRTHVTHIYLKLGVDGRADLFRVVYGVDREGRGLGRGLE